MKHYILPNSICILFILMLIQSCQSLTTPQTKQYALTIRLTDIQGKPVQNAKVVLQAMDQPDKKANYDKREQFYYFKEIHEGYHTILADHPEYNPKGFQDPDGLPTQIDLQLYNPYQVRIPGDTINYYMEDPYKLVVAVNKDVNLEEAKTKLREIAVKWKLEEPIVDINSQTNYEVPPWGASYFFLFTKKNKQKFHRFFCKELAQFRQSKYVKYAGFFSYITKDQQWEYIDSLGQAVFNPKDSFNLAYRTKMLKSFEVDKVSKKFLLKDVLFTKRPARYYLDNRNSLRSLSTHNDEVLLNTSILGVLVKSYDDAQVIPILNLVENYILTYLDVFRKSEIIHTSFNNIYIETSTVVKLNSNTPSPDPNNYIYMLVKTEDQSIGLGINDILEKRKSPILKSFIYIIHN